MYFINRKSRTLILLLSIYWLNGFSQGKDNLEVISFISENHNFLVRNKTISNAYLKRYEINFEELNFWNPCKQKFEADKAFLNKEEWEALNSEFQKLKKQRLPNKILKVSNKKNSTSHRITSITLPILFRDNTYAVYYFEQRYGGEINLLKKEKGEWKRYCSYIVWIE